MEVLLSSVSHLNQLDEDDDFFACRQEGQNDVVAADWAAQCRARVQDRRRTMGRQKTPSKSSG
jgi:hypothetical protein